MLCYIVWDIAPDVFSIDLFESTFPIKWYGLLFASAFLVGQFMLTTIFRTERMEESHIETLFLYMVIATVIGTRLGHYLFYEWELLFSNPQKWFLSMISLPFRGLASHGALFAIPLALYLYSRGKNRPPFLWLVDRIVIAVALGGAMIRLGNLLNSEIYGTPTALPWGFVFVRETDYRLLPLIPRHPTQLYEAFFCLFLFGLTFYLWKQKRHQLPSGTVAGLFMVLLFSFRFLVEFLKTPQEAFENTLPLNMGQWLSIPAIIAGALLLVFIYKVPRTSGNIHATPNISQKFR
ncbi:prolipoprotein diacylglyceryl transferase [Runella rosea]|uniref:Phosphatidylglycerol--prolipoprotein diacylglyceryl transferase n=1 Tax=Runella rosea TaxID=2259595 RepID=A0A344TRW4_9BACT|nr:prolipoprotein diacylglyceryl transferase [Runella rosea]AXE21385.1 prolipoprotein diacylglyceryl transferase [Runella rosea]